MGPTDARARKADQDKVTVTFYGGNGYDGHAVLDEDAARRLRDDLNTCLTGMATERLAARWEGSE
jgi:hypothetical protein